MPNTHETLTSLFSDIADAIRAKTGSEDDIVADDFPFAISNIPSGGDEALINGRRFECGTFTFPAAVTSDYTIQHTLGTTPSAVFLWVIDPDYSVRGQFGKFRVDSTTSMNSVTIVAVNGGFAVGTGVNWQRYRTSFDSTTITFSCDSSYPLLPNMEYQWLAIA